MLLLHDQREYEYQLLLLILNLIFSKFIYSLTFSITGSISNASLPSPDEIK